MDCVTSEPRASSGLSTQPLGTAGHWACTRSQGPRRVGGPVLREPARAHSTCRCHGCRRPDPVPEAACPSPSVPLSPADPHRHPPDEPRGAAAAARRDGGKGRRPGAPPLLSWSVWLGRFTQEQVWGGPAAITIGRSCPASVSQVPLQRRGARGAEVTCRVRGVWMRVAPPSRGPGPPCPPARHAAALAIPPLAGVLDLQVPSLPPMAADVPTHLRTPAFPLRGNAWSCLWPIFLLRCRSDFLLVIDLYTLEIPTLPVCRLHRASPAPGLFLPVSSAAVGDQKVQRG